MMKKIFAILTLASICTADTLWNDDKSQKDQYNCAGYVTDAICCQDRYCMGQSESGCKSDKRNLFCSWDESKSKCLAVRDAANNVCCQVKPVEGCKDFVKGQCPEQFQVKQGCCSDEGMKWNAIFKGVEPGKVCCNTPCKDADDLKCAQPGRCNQRSFFSGSYLNPADYGFGNSLNKKYTIGNVFQSIIPSVNVDNSAQFEDFQTNEVTVDDIITMMIDALENDQDVVDVDRTLQATPYGRVVRHNAMPYFNNYVPADLIIQKLYSPFGLQGLSGYGQGPYGSPYGGGHSGYGQGPYGPSYGGQSGYSQGHYGSPYGGHSGYGQGPYGSPYGGQSGYGQGPHGSPYGGQSGYGQGPYGSPYGDQSGYGQGPYGSQSGYGQGPYGSPYGGQSGYGQEHGGYEQGGSKYSDPYKPSHEEPTYYQQQN